MKVTIFFHHRDDCVGFHDDLWGICLLFVLLSEAKAKGKTEDEIFDALKWLREKIVSRSS